jgi:hypothetical protein
VALEQCPEWGGFADGGADGIAIRGRDCAPHVGPRLPDSDLPL